VALDVPPFWRRASYKQNLVPDAVLPAAAPSLALRSSISSANCLNASVLRAPLASRSMAGTAGLGRLRSVRVVGQFPCPSIESPYNPADRAVRPARSIGLDRIPRFHDLQRARNAQENGTTFRPLLVIGWFKLRPAGHSPSLFFPLAAASASPRAIVRASASGDDSSTRAVRVPNSVTTSIVVSSPKME
jgi:hypothetical protein